MPKLDAEMEEWRREKEKTMPTICDRLGGELKKDVCMVDDFPAPGTVEEWQKDASMPWTALEEEHDVSFVARMTPQDAKKMFTSLPERVYHQPTIKKLRARLRKNQPISPPWVEFCKRLREDELEDMGMEGMKFNFGYAESCIVGHEGRHRIEAAIAAGLKTIPVIFRRKPSHYCHEKAE